MAGFMKRVGQKVLQMQQAQQPGPQQPQEQQFGTAVPQDLASMSIGGDSNAAQAASPLPDQAAGGGAKDQVFMSAMQNRTLDSQPPTQMQPSLPMGMGGQMDPGILQMLMQRLRRPSYQTGYMGQQGGQHGY